MPCAALSRATKMKTSATMIVTTFASGCRPHATWFLYLDSQTLRIRSCEMLGERHDDCDRYTLLWQLCRIRSPAMHRVTVHKIQHDQHGGQRRG